MASEEFDDLVRRAQAGDRASLDRLLETFRPQMERIAREYSDPADSVESVSDLIQEAQLRAWQRVAQFRGGANGSQTEPMFQAWIGQIVRTVALNLIEARNRQRRRPPGGGLQRLGGSSESSGAGAAEPPGSESTPSAQARKGEEFQIIQQALEKVPDEVGREIVRLRVLEEISFQEIADRLDLTYDQVRERYHATLRKLERHLRGRL